MYKGSNHAGNVVISNHATSNMSRDKKLSFIVKLGAPTKIACLRHTLQQQLFLILSYILFFASRESTVSFPSNEHLFRNNIAKVFRMAFRFCSDDSFFFPRGHRHPLHYSYESFFHCLFYSQMHFGIFIVFSWRLNH